MSMRFAGLTPLYSINALPALSNATIYCTFYANDNTGPYTIWAVDTTGGFAGNYYLKITGGLLQFTTQDNILSGNVGAWTCSVSATTRYCCGLKYDFNSNESSDPVIYLNGVKQTMTEVSTPASIPAHPSSKMTIGARAWYLEGSYEYLYEQFSGRIGDIYIATRQHTDDEMERHTKSWVKGFSYYHQKGDALLYCPLDEINDSVAQSTTNTLWPNGDVNSLWSGKTQATYWESINADTTDYIEAGKNDDAEEQQCDMETFTIPAGSTVGMVALELKGYDSSETGSMTVKIKKGASWLSWSLDLNNSTATVYTHTWFGSWTQAEIDGMQIGLLTPTMGKNSSITIYYVKALVYTYTKYCKDYVGTNGFISKTATGAPEEMLTYV